MLLPMYSRPSIAIDRGDGPYVYDTNGRRYLDFITGVGVNALGHNHPRITQVIAEQAARCIHTSNLYHHAYQKPLAEKLAQWAGLDSVFFTNSGSEAIETALKAAKARGKHHLIAVENSFHGRTMGSLSITGQPKYRKPFQPMLPGVDFIRPNCLDDLASAFRKETAAIIVEPVQGEGGIHILTAPFLLEAQRLARRYDALFIADEVQCGLGRTGTRFAYQRISGLQPDIVVTAKPLAAGLPLAATIFSHRAAEALAPGMHGSTFGGGPLACRVASEVLAIIDELLPDIRENAIYLRERLQELLTIYGVREIRTAGLMAAIQLNFSGAPLVEEAMRQGLLINCTHETTLRMLPPFTITRSQIDEACNILGSVVQAAQESGSVLAYL